jgi:hypothetical protein
MNEKYYYHKRIEQPLLVQTSADAAVFAATKNALNAALTAITAQEEALRTPVSLVVAREHQGDPRFENSVASQAYRAAQSEVWRILDSDNGKPNQKIAQQITDSAFRTIWNEAIELAAQVTGGTAGSLIRDLKEDSNFNSKHSDRIGN